MANRVGIKGLLLLLFIQKRNEECRSSPLFRVLEMQRSAAAAHLFLHDMKPQAMVSIMQTCGILSVETFGRAGEGFFGESGAFVFRIHTQRAGMRRIGEARFGKRKMHRCLGRRVRHRIVHKVHHASRHIGGMGDLSIGRTVLGSFGCGSRAPWRALPPSRRYRRSMHRPRRRRLLWGKGLREIGR